MFSKNTSEASRSRDVCWSSFPIRAFRYWSERLGENAQRGDTGVRHCAQSRGEGSDCHPFPSRKSKLLIFLFLALAVTPACFVRKHPITSPAARRQNGVFLAATKEQLIQRVHGVSDPIQSFLMRTELSPSVLERSKATETDYATVGAYILFQKPDGIRILAQDPMLGSTIFDMVSNGREFRVSIPRKKRFIIGNTDSPGSSENKLENLRPDAFLTSLMIYPPNAESDLTVLEIDTERALYVLLILEKNQDQFLLARDIYFDGHTLQITRQKTFDVSGIIASDTKYSDWKRYSGVSFPSEIDIQRPKDNCEVQLSVVSMKVNTPDVTTGKFILEQPPDTQLQRLK